MVEELQVMSNTCLCTQMSKRRVVIRSSTGRNLDNCLPALNWLAYEESLMDEVLERNRVGLLNYFNKIVARSPADLTVEHYLGTISNL